MVAAAAACIMLSPKIYWGGFNLPVQLPFFLIGFLLADLRVFQQTARHVLWDIVSIVLWGVVFLIPGSWGYGPLAIAIAGAFASSLRAPMMRWFLSRRPIAIMGGMCYSLYLLHMLVLETFFPLTRHAMILKSYWADVLTQVVILMPIILAVGLGYYLLIERPCMNPKWPEELRQRMKQTTALWAKPASATNGSTY
jgi:peptidoglycan/LPS O-acetylase OafA/YrhL